MKKFCLAYIFLLSTFLPGQSYKSSVGTGIGLGSFNGNFPSQSTLNGKIYFEFSSPFSLFDKLDLNATFGQKIEKFLPGSYNYKHYSYFTSFGFTGKFVQPLNNVFTVEEGIGLIYLNDRSFSDIDEWNIGVLINIAAGMPISKKFDLLLNADYGLTFTNTSSSYISFLILFKYSL
ncbi:MAG: hypothetical protein OQJ81_08735 [Melioribacteraceae bacterium]|nr:hypothetical protein [Melioribacteraceae bacterium]